MNVQRLINHKILSFAISSVLLFAVGASARVRQGSTVSPTAVNFGTKTVGATSAPATVTFTNNSRFSVKISSVSLSQIQFAYSGPALPITLAPGQSFAGALTFSPTGARKYTDFLVFTLANGSSQVIGLSGTGAQPQVTPVPVSPVPPVSPVVPVVPVTPVTPVTPVPPVAPTDPPTSLVLTAAPCDSNFNCVAGSTASVGQFVRITAHVVYSSTVAPTGQLCILDNGVPLNCGLTPVADENWFVNSLAAGTHKLSATYAGDSTNGGSTSGTSTLTVGSSASASSLVAPKITLQPISQTVTVGQTATFSVQTTGTSPISYQWSANGTAIPGATSVTYTTAATKATDNTTQFTVAVTNPAGNVGSSAATLTVSSGTVQLTANPSSLSFGNTTIGAGNTLSVALTNSGNSAVNISNTTIGGSGFTASGVNGTILNPGQTANLSVTFTPTGTTPVTGSVSVTSNAPAVKINLSGAGVQPTVTSITVNPANQTVAVGAQMQFTAVDNFGNDITSSVNWSSSNSSVVSISATGLATGMANGTATIAASK